MSNATSSRLRRAFPHAAWFATFLIGVSSALVPALGGAQISLLSAPPPQAAPAGSVSQSCLLDQTRRQGKTFDTCMPDTSLTDGQCYKACPSGWSGKATECYAPCPPGFPDNGLYCGKPAPTTSGGYVVWDEAKCKRENAHGCYKSGALWYPNCAPGFQKRGDPICSPVCPQGFQDVGVSCKKPTQTRGAGFPMSRCSAGRERFLLLCYDACPAGYKAQGDMCVAGQCPTGSKDAGGWCCVGDDCKQPPAHPNETAYSSLLTMPANTGLRSCKEVLKAPPIPLKHQLGKYFRENGGPATIYYYDPVTMKKRPVPKALIDKHCVTLFSYEDPQSVKSIPTGEAYSPACSK